MFKDYDKYLSTSLKVYLFVLVIIFILKLVGLDYFGLDVNNSIMIIIDNFLTKTKLVYLIDFITLFIMFYIYMAIVCNNKKVYKETFIATLIEFTLQYFLMKIDKNTAYKSYIDFAIFMIAPIFINKKLKVRKQLFIILLIIIYQIISYVVRNQVIYSNYYSKIEDILLNIDLYIMLFITYKIYFMKGDVNVCHEVGSSLQMKANLKNLQKKFQKNYSNFKKLNKQEKATIIIYSILSLFWNVFTLVIVLIIAKLNDTFIECIFIITSFWLSKKVFGKTFHLKSMVQCFIVSNVTYYILNRITTPTGISILIPIMLGVGLSYITSKLVKRTYKPLYKGMPKEEFENTILKVVDKDSSKYNICYDFFINKQNAIYLSHKYNYSEPGIRKITSRVNDDIKALNK